jgi:hypothetical protein
MFLGVESTKAASVAIILHLVVFAPATLFGLYYVLKEGLSLDRLRRIGEQQSENAGSSGNAPQPEAAHPEVVHEVVAPDRVVIRDA